VRHTPVVHIRGTVAGQTYFGGYPAPVCRATVKDSSIKRCTIREHKASTHNGITNVRITATAVSRTGLKASRTIRIRTEQFKFGGKTASSGTYVLRLGATYTLLVASNAKPLYVDAAVAPQSPAGVHDWFTPAGSAHHFRLWKLAVNLPTGLDAFRYWSLGVKIDGRTQILTIRT
jgi:hypothetical protein